jgi:uncharacterized 2Fe-2S/4Fe-4S cluster protein (DUF4445 family)
MLTILPLGKMIEAKPGTILLDAIRQAGIEISSPCNGRQMCGKCKVRLDPAPALVAPHEHLTIEEGAAGIRLACQTVIQEEMKVMLPEDCSMDTHILEGELIKKSNVAPAAKIKKINGEYQLFYRNLPPVFMSTWKPIFSPKGIAVDL